MRFAARFLVFAAVMWLCTSAREAGQGSTRPLPYKFQRSNHNAKQRKFSER